MTARTKLAAGLALLAAALALAVLIALITGPAGTSISLSELFGAEHAGPVKIRAARALLGIVVGAGLATAGVILQALLRNPLADPYVLGVSSGGGLGAVLAILAGAAVRGPWAVPGAAFLGAALAILLVYALAHVGKTVPVYTLLLAGVIVSSLASSLLLFLVHTNIAANRQLQSVMWWLLGSLQILDAGLLTAAALAIALGLLAALFFARDLNVLALGEEPAAHLGLHVERTKRLLFLLASLITGAAVATSGLIGFVGLIVPHAVRLLVGPDHKVLLPLTALSGALFLVVCDTLARSLFHELPIGVLTAFLGGPFFIYLLRSRRGSL